MRKVGKVVSSIVNTFIVVAFFMLSTYGFSSVLVGWLVSTGIEWVSVTNLGLMVIGLLGGLIWAVFTKITNKYWDAYYSDWSDADEPTR